MSPKRGRNISGKLRVDFQMILEKKQGQARMNQAFSSAEF